MPFSSLAISAVAVKSTSEDEFSAVSHESCKTPMIKPTPTTCMAISFGIPNKLHARGMSKSEPPATPEAPAAAIADRTLRISAVRYLLLYQAYEQLQVSRLKL